jgi:hypothetical protein
LKYHPHNTFLLDLDAILDGKGEKINSLQAVHKPDKRYPTICDHTSTLTAGADSTEEYAPIAISVPVPSVEKNPGMPRHPHDLESSKGFRMLKFMFTPLARIGTGREFRLTVV